MKIHTPPSILRFGIIHAALAALCLMLPVGPARSAIVTLPVYHVVPGGSGTHGGDSWENAMDLQEAIANAGEGSEIWVKSGTYKPGSQRTDSFPLKSGVSIYGGFSGTETQRDQRNPNPASNATILSGDLDGDDFEGPFSNTETSENAYHVVSGNGADATSILDGFVISGGFADDWGGNEKGGGMLLSGSSPTLSNLIFRRNVSFNGGGGIYAETSHPTLLNVLFIENGNSGGGAGMANLDSNPSLTNVVFIRNRAFGTGAIANTNSHPVLTNVTVTENSGAVAAGGMSNLNSSPVVRNSIFWGNTTQQGSANEIENYENSQPTISDSIIAGGYEGGTNIIDADPLFVDVENGDLHLQSGSPAVDAGNGDVEDPSLPATDFEGNLRVRGTAVDFGAYESPFSKVTAPPVPDEPAKLSVRGSGNFGAENVGSTSNSNRFEVTNIGGKIVVGLAARVKGADRRHFQVSRPTSRSLAPGGTAIVTAKFRPRTAGNFRAELVVNGRGVTPVSISLSGRGKAIPPRVRPFGRIL